MPQKTVFSPIRAPDEPSDPRVEHRVPGTEYSDRCTGCRTVNGAVRPTNQVGLRKGGCGPGTIRTSRDQLHDARFSDIASFGRIYRSPSISIATVRYPVSSGGKRSGQNLG